MFGGSFTFSFTKVILLLKICMFRLKLSDLSSNIFYFVKCYRKNIDANFQFKLNLIMSNVQIRSSLCQYTFKEINHITFLRLLLQV